MRTRFPDVGYYLSNPIEELETLTFLQFLVPQVSPSPPVTSTFSDLLFLRSNAAFKVSPRIENLPIETALSKFVSDVLPQNIHIAVEDFSSATGKSFGSRRLLEDNEVLNEKKEVERQSTSKSEAVEIEVPKKSEGSAVNNQVPQRYEVTQFETPELTPELDGFVEYASFFENKGIQILSEVAEIEKSLDMLKPGLATPYPYEVQESVLSVEDMTFEYPMEGNSGSFENGCSFQDQIHFNQITFPMLEVDEIVLEHTAGFSMEEKLLSFIEKIDLQRSQEDNHVNDDKELLGSKEYDVLGLLSDHCLSSHSLGSVNSSPEIDLINLVEISQIKMNSGVHGTSYCDCFLSDKPVVFQEFHILDVDSSQIFEDLFNRQTVYEPEICDGMFNDDMNFKNFNKLIVSHELILLDDTFRSLPVPVLSDNDKLKSSYAIIEGKLCNLKPQPLSALDGIYLDWHILEEDKYNCTYSEYENILKDMGSHNIDFDWNSFGDRTVVYDFIFSDDGVYGFNKKDNGESKEFLSDVLIPTDTTVAVESSKLLDKKFPQPENGERLAKKNADRASLLFKSMSQPNDLDFFLNSQKANIGPNNESAVRPVNNSCISPKLSLGKSVAALSQGKEPITILDMDENVNNQKKLFNYTSIEGKYNMRSKEAAEVEACGIPSLIPSAPFAEESKHSHDSMVSVPETVIVVNTQNLDKEMIVSRRSTYQKILALEKGGAQVVERDSDLPVDIIINSAICLVWYDFRNIGKKATALDEASSCLPLCVENIAANVLTLLSFTFSGCILVFEGENSFLSTVMESSDGLYAAAASLGIDVQIFCSYSSQLTDEIIMNCIGYATRGVYPRMPESETLAESFLTKFPSLNPLTAHAILSSGGMLIEFLEWSNESRIRAIHKYNVPDESINLFGALCEYGEREDSRSIMTDCSSSVSSGIDSERFNLNVASKRKRWKYDDSLDKSDTHLNDLWHIDPVKQFSKETFHEFRNPRLYESNLFPEEQSLDEATMMNPSIVPKAYDFQMSKEPQMFKEIRKPDFSLNDKLSGQPQGTDMAMLKKFDINNISGSEIQFEDQKGEVIDLTGSPGSGKAFSSIANSMSFLMPGMEKDAARKSKIARRLSFGKNHQPTFQAGAEIFSGSNIWSSGNDQWNSLPVGPSNYSYTDHGDDVTLSKQHNKLVEDCFKQSSAEKSRGFQFPVKDSSHFGDKSRGFQLQEKDSPRYGGTPLSNALCSDSPQRKSPWTMEFLNKMREKSRFRHQSLSLDASALGPSGNIAKVTKRRSPSILEFFKYQGGSTKRKIVEQKKHKQSVQSSSSKDEKTSASILSTWTPPDKRAQQTLSFAMNDGESQTKLVWNDGTHNLSKKFQNQL